MSVITIAKPGTAKVFPGAAVEAKLRSSLLDVVQSNASMMGVTLPAGLPAQYASATQIDSLDVVDLLCGVESLLGFELKDSIVKAGGYTSINAAIGHVMPRIESAWQKNENKGGKK